MCGIAGVIASSAATRVDAPQLQRLAAPLVHRGPDDEGVYVDPAGRAGLAFRRLAIIDLAGGHQPLSNETGTLWLVFNGEIYNFRPLRSELESHGHHFRTVSDAEVIVHGFEQWQEGVFARLEGMFAIALWDETAGRLTLARDRLGKKPLHFADFDGQLYFGSELKAMLAVRPDLPRRIDPQALHRYFTFQYVPAPFGIFERFGKIMPGCWASLTPAACGKFEQHAYWNPPAVGGFTGSYRAARDRLGALLTAAVQKRLVADVPLGAFLSGGIDSSIVVGLMRQLGVSPLRTFTIAFDDPRYDESAHARVVARHFQTEHHEFTVTPQAREILDLLAYHYDEPMADSSAIPTYYVSRWTRQRVTVALTGDAGDECFGGYDRYRALQLAAWFDGLPRGARRSLAALAGRIPPGRTGSARHRASRFLRCADLSPADRYLQWICVFSPEVLARAYEPEFASRLALDEPRDWFGRHFARAAGSDSQRAAAADLSTYLPYDLLTKVDIASMACSLECRSPFLDHELVEFAFSLPDRWKLGVGGGKRILKDWARSLLPPPTLRREKKGFGVPIGEWFRHELRPLLRDALLAPDAPCARIFRREWLAELLAEHQERRANHDHRLWALLMFECWARRWSARLD
ncbi:MAG: Asparagine synthetase [glutamine-hydrolyzing] 1 [Phycisphaerae bacterium]|nr:Asparagine synthetase [glutamine-hydrolyzing] 1 [Phycisphaerae bacterium]